MNGGVDGEIEGRRIPRAQRTRQTDEWRAKWMNELEQQVADGDGCTNRLMTGWVKGQGTKGI